MYYGEIKNCDIADGLGVRVSLFVSGCRNHCKGCFNQMTWDFLYGKEFDQETINKIIELLKPNYIDGFSLLGGEPFEPENQEELVRLLKEIKENYPKKNIWCYTGYTYEEIQADPALAAVLPYIDVLVDGRFRQELYSPHLEFRGSSNQRIIRLTYT